MNRNIRNLAAAFVTLLSVTTLAVAQNEQRYKELPNFSQINDRLYRGGQPKREGFKRLSELGIKTVVNLRRADDRARADEARAEAAGLSYFNVAMPIHARPTHEQIERVLSIIKNPDNGSVFIYCRRGADRTGTVIAVYRISNDGWTSEKAQAEANQNGMFFTQLEMKDYIKNYYCGNACADASCDDQRFMEQFGIVAARATRIMVEEVSEHSLTRTSVRQLRRFFR